MQMKTLLRRASVAAGLALAFLVSDRAAYAVSTPVVIPTGATITPDAAPGAVFQNLSTSLPDYPTYFPDSAEASAVSPDGKTLLILTSGYNFLLDSNGHFQSQDSSEFVFVFDISSPSVPVQKQVLMVPNAFSGLVWSPDGSRFYVAGGATDTLHTYAQSAGSWAELGSAISLAHSGDLMNQETFVGPTAAGVGITADGSTVVVANYETDSITAVDVVHGVILAEYDLRPGLINPAQTGVPGGEFPVGVAIKGSNTVYVSSSRDREIDVVNLSGGALTLTNRIPVQGNPNRMVLNKAQSTLFVASDNADSLILIDTASNTVTAQVNTSAPAGILGSGKKVPKGSNPNSVTLSADENTAYVTNGGTNSVSVISLAGKKPAVTGLIPTGWQPNSVSISSDASTLYVINGRSNTSADPGDCRFINAGGNYGSACQPVAAQNGSANQYAWQNMKSGLLVLPVPSSSDLASLTAQVAENNGFNLQLSQQDISTMLFLRQHIQHVVYVVKENRTYDQILGDLPVGNGDPTLTQFPSFVTPNFHAMATNFVDFDNFYDPGSASMEGWQWSTAARALDLNEKSQVSDYGKGGSNYDSEGTARNINVGISGVAVRKAWQPLYPPDLNLLPGTANEVAADGPNGEQGLGYIWDAAIRAHLKVRNYGFFLDLGAVFTSPSVVDPCHAKPAVRVAFPAHPSLVKRTDPCFWGFDNRVPDFFRYKEWEREFDQQVKTNSFPNLEMVRLMHDHFGNFGSAVYGVNTPELQMADNDYAVALLVDKIAHSPYAGNTLVFIVEDDSQDGADHVSANRSTAFIVGPYVKHGAVSSAHYATTNMLRTIGEVLGTEHLGIHDAGLPPMTDAFDTTQTNWTFNAFPALVLFNTQLPLLNKDKVRATNAIPQTTHDAAWWEAKTKGFDFSSEDRVDPDKFNRVIWEGLMGGRPYPTRRSEPKSEGAAGTGK